MRLLAVGLALAVTLPLAEGLLRWWAPLDPRENSSWYQAHPVYHFRHRAHLDEEFVWAQPYHVRTNARGLREPEEVPYGEHDPARVVVLGDSFTFGVGVAYDHTYAQVAQAQLRRQSCPAARLVNLGVSAHGPSLEYLYYREEGARYGAAWVVVGVFLGNDVADDARDKAFELSGDRLEPRPFHISWLKRCTDQAWYQWLIRRSQLVVRLRQGYSWLVDTVLARDSRQAQLAALTSVAAVERGWPLTAAVYAALVAEAQAHQARVLFLLIPTREQVLCEAGRPAQAPDLNVAQATRTRLLALAARRNWTTIDLLTPLAQAARRGEQLYLEGDFHFNEQGHQIAGDALAQALAPLLTAAPGTSGTNEGEH